LQKPLHHQTLSISKRLTRFLSSSIYATFTSVASESELLGVLSKRDLGETGVQLKQQVTLSWAAYFYCGYSVVKNMIIVAQDTYHADDFAPIKGSTCNRPPAFCLFSNVQAAGF